jgi:hypothetical protein
MKSAARPGRKPLSLGVFSPTPGMGQWVLTDLQHETEEVDAMAARRAAPARFSRLLKKVAGWNGFPSSRA